MSVASSCKTYYINLSHDKKYPIVFGEKCSLSIDKKDLGEATRALIVTNKTVESACSEGLGKITRSAGFRC